VPGKYLEAFGGIGALDDLDGPVAMSGHGVAQFRPGIAAVGKDMAQPWVALADRFEHIDSAVPVLNVSPVDEDEDQKTAWLGQDVAPFDFAQESLATLDLLACVPRVWLCQPEDGRHRKPRRFALF